MSQAVTVFNFREREIRVIMRNGDPWWIAKDVCDVLDLDNVTRALDRLDDDEKGFTTSNTPGGNQSLLCVNEPGLYSLILTSRKPEAKTFKRWVTHEVLPSIRKTGSYATHQEAAKAPLQGWEPDIVNDPDRLARTIRYEEAKVRFLQAAQKYHYPQKQQKQSPILNRNKTAQLPSPKLTSELIQAKIIRHLSSKGPMTLNVLRTSYLKEYDANTLSTHLAELIQQGKVCSFTTSHSTKFGVKESEETA